MLDMKEGNTSTSKVISLGTKIPLPPAQIAEMIKSGKWKSIEKMNIDDFVYEVSPNEYEPFMKSIIQSRPETYDPTFVERAVRRSKAGINNSKSATVVYFPETSVINGEEIESNSFRLIDRTHGMVIDKYLGKKEKIANVVNFKHDLGSNELKLYRLANLLNKVDDEVQPLVDEAIKTELYRLMDKRVSEGKEGKPSDEERRSFLKDYPQINDRIWSNWVSGHKTGGRRSPRITYSDSALTAFHDSLKNMKCYEGWVIIKPTTTVSWSGEALGRAIIKCCDNEMRKLLIPLYANNDAQSKSLSGGKLEEKIKIKFNQLKEFYNFEEFEYVMMNY